MLKKYEMLTRFNDSGKRSIPVCVALYYVPDYFVAKKSWLCRPSPSAHSLRKIVLEQMTKMEHLVQYKHVGTRIKCFRSSTR